MFLFWLFFLFSKLIWPFFSRENQTTPPFFHFTPYLCPLSPSSSYPHPCPYPHSILPSSIWLLFSVSSFSHPYDPYFLFHPSPIHITLIPLFIPHSFMTLILLFILPPSIPFLISYPPLFRAPYPSFHPPLTLPDPTPSPPPLIYPISSRYRSSQPCFKYIISTDLYILPGIECLHIWSLGSPGLIIV